MTLGRHGKINWLLELEDSSKQVIDYQSNMKSDLNFLHVVLLGADHAIVTYKSDGNESLKKWFSYLTVTEHFISGSEMYLTLHNQSISSWFISVAPAKEREHRCSLT